MHFRDPLGRRRVVMPGPIEAQASAPQPVAPNERTHNPLRPSQLDDMIGQYRMRRMLRRVIDGSLHQRTPLDHMLLVGPSGYGKSTVANIVANELGVQVFQVEAPVSHDTLIELRTAMADRDVLFIDEVHQQAVMERRGRSSSTQPEVLFNVMEDRTLVTSLGVLPFPAITVIAATTDEGMLPDAFINRFPLRPVFERYTVTDLELIAHHNADALGCYLKADAGEMFATAARATPRVLNNYMRNAESLTPSGVIDANVAAEVLFDLNDVTADGLTRDMQNVLIFLFTRAKRENKSTGEVAYQASVATIATAIGKSRDQKAVQLRVEPYLIEKGYLQVGHGGRLLTPDGLDRAKELVTQCPA